MKESYTVICRHKYKKTRFKWTQRNLICEREILKTIKTRLENRKVLRTGEDIGKGWSTESYFL